MNFGQERRKYPRYVLREGAFAGSHPNIGGIVDISLGGILFHYLGIANTSQEFGDFVICGDDGFCLDDLSHRVISDRVLAGKSPFSKIITRERRIEFKTISDEQKRLLNSFIKNHTI